MLGWCVVDGGLWMVDEIKFQIQNSKLKKTLNSKSQKIMIIGIANSTRRI